MMNDEKGQRTSERHYWGLEWSVCDGDLSIYENLLRTLRGLFSCHTKALHLYENVFFPLHISWVGRCRGGFFVPEMDYARTNEQLRNPQITSGEIAGCIFWERRRRGRGVYPAQGGGNITFRCYAPLSFFWLGRAFRLESFLGRS